MNIIDKLFNKYGIKYNRASKVLHIRESIPVKEFMLIRKIVTSYDIEDIIVGRW